MILLFCLGVATAVVTWALAWLVYRFAMKHKIYPAIRERDVHAKPTPRLGGVAIYVGILFGFGLAYVISPSFPVLKVTFADPVMVWAILGAGLLVVIVGIFDDLFDLDWMVKLGAQIAAAALVAWLGVQILSLPVGGIAVGSPLMSVIMTILVIVLAMNALNFIDGLDGLLVGIAIISNCAFLIYTYLITAKANPLNYFSLASVVTAILIGACVGFLPINWHPAKMFMGDSGSMLLGLFTATTAIVVTGQFDETTLQSVVGRTHLIPAFLPIVLPLAVCAVPVIDFTFAVVRRLIAGKSPFSADRRHLHHLMLDLGHSVLQATIILYAWAVVIAGGMLLFLFAPLVPPWAAAAFLVLGLVACAIVTLLPAIRRRIDARREPGAGGASAAGVARVAGAASDVATDAGVADGAGAPGVAGAPSAAGATSPLIGQENK